MKSLSATKLLCLIALSAVACSFAGAGFPTLDDQKTSSFTVWEVANSNKRFNVTGTVASVSYASNSLNINASGQRVEILITPTTVIEFRGEAGSIADIRRGHKVTAS